MDKLDVAVVHIIKSELCDGSRRRSRINKYSIRDIADLDRDRFSRVIHIIDTKHRRCNRNFTALGDR